MSNLVHGASEERRGAIRIGRYGPGTDEWEGYVEPSGADPGWILYFRADGSAVVYTERDETGAVCGQPIALPARARVSADTQELDADSA